MQGMLEMAKLQMEEWLRALRQPSTSTSTGQRAAGADGFHAHEFMLPLEMNMQTMSAVLDGLGLGMEWTRSPRPADAVVIPEGWPASRSASLPAAPRRPTERRGPLGAAGPLPGMQLMARGARRDGPLHEQVDTPSGLMTIHPGGVKGECFNFEVPMGRGAMVHEMASRPAALLEIMDAKLSALRNELAAQTAKLDAAALSAEDKQLVEANCASVRQERARLSAIQAEPALLDLYTVTRMALHGAVAACVLLSRDNMGSRLEMARKLGVEPSIFEEVAVDGDKVATTAHASDSAGKALIATASVASLALESVPAARGPRRGGDRRAHRTAARAAMRAVAELAAALPRRAAASRASSTSRRSCDGARRGDGQALSAASTAGATSFMQQLKNKALDASAQAMAKVGDTPLNRRGTALAGSMMHAVMSGAVGLRKDVPIGRQVDDVATRLAAAVKPSLLAAPSKAAAEGANWTAVEVGTKKKAAAGDVKQFSRVSRLRMLRGPRGKPSTVRLVTE